MHPDHDPDASPVNALPPMVVVLFLVIVAVELTLSLADRGLVGGAGGIGWRLDAVNNWAFSTQWMDLMAERGTWYPSQVVRLVTYPFVQSNFTQALFVAVFLLALGKFVGEVFHPLAVLAVFVLSGVGGALIYWLAVSEAQWLIGGFPAVYGLIGAFSYILFVRFGELQQNQIMAFRLIAFLLAIQLVFGLLFGGPPDWIADIGGFACGFLLSFLVAPGGWRRFRDRMRRP